MSALAVSRILTRDADEFYFSIVANGLLVSSSFPCSVTQDLFALRYTVSISYGIATGW